LLQQPAFNAAVVEVPDAPASERILGFGAVVFVTRDFAERELAHPAPGLNSRVFASFVNGTPVILDERGLRTNNAGIGLDLIVLISTCRPGLPPDDVSEVRARLTSSFLEIHLGYRFNQLLFEATDRAEVEYTVSTHVYRLADHFIEFHRLNPSTRWNRDRGLFVINRSDALAATGSIASLLFEMRAPRLHLRTSDQTLAGAALQGRTDPELALALGISMAAVKKRWLALYERIGRLEPALLADAAADGDKPTRGPLRGTSQELLRHALRGDTDDELARALGITTAAVKKRWIKIFEDVERRVPSFGNLSPSHDSVRGPQRRHRLLAYVREHPEELRPFPARGQRPEARPMR